jgi:phosphoglycolate phosphatase
MPCIRLVVFDLDGTLVDSARDLADSANALIAGVGGRPLSVDAVTRMVGDGAATLVRRALDAAGVTPHPAGALERFLSVYDGQLLVHTKVYDGMIAALDRIGRVAELAVLTNKPARSTDRVLDGLGLARFFEGGVVAGDGPLARKPDPAGLRHLIDRAGATAEETMMVGDSPIDLETARRAGTRACLARWGFGFRIDERELGAGVVVVGSPEELAEVIERAAR